MKETIILDGKCTYSDDIIPGVYRVSYPHPQLRKTVCCDYYSDRKGAQIAAVALIQTKVTGTLDIDRLAEDGKWIPIDRW